MRRSRLVIAGLGVAGSTLAMLAARAGYDVEAFDPSTIYTKPCGDAVTLRPWIRKLLEELDVVVTGVREYRILVDGRAAADITFPGNNWYIVDKNEMVHRIRAEARKSGARLRRARLDVPCECRGRCLCVDARGPFKHPRETWVLTARIIARLRERWNPGAALIEFYPSRGGLFWVFPASDNGKLVNMGAGWLNGTIGDALRLTAERAREILGSYEEVSIKGAPIAVFSPVEPVGPGGVVRVGEAGGLVISSAGEGNRPGMESARVLVDALREAGYEGVTSAYRRSVGRLVSEARASRLALRLASKWPRLFSRVMRGIGRDFWEKYLRAEITMGVAARYIASIPLALARG